MKRVDHLVLLRVSSAALSSTEKEYDIQHAHYIHSSRLARGDSRWIICKNERQCRCMHSRNEYKIRGVVSLRGAGASGGPFAKACIFLASAESLGRAAAPFTPYWMRRRYCFLQI